MAYILALVVAVGSFSLYMSAFFFPEVYRKYDLTWSGVGLFYALVLWVCAGQMRGGVLLGQVAAVTLLGWLGWQTLKLRRELVPDAQRTDFSGSANLWIKAVRQRGQKWLGSLPQTLHQLKLPGNLNHRLAQWVEMTIKSDSQVQSSRNNEAGSGLDSAAQQSTSKSSAKARAYSSGQPTATASHISSESEHLTHNTLPPRVAQVSDRINEWSRRLIFGTGDRLRNLQKSVSTLTKRKANTSQASTSRQAPQRGAHPIRSGDQANDPNTPIDLGVASFEDIECEHAEQIESTQTAQTAPTLEQTDAPEENSKENSELADDRSEHPTDWPAEEGLEARVKSPDSQVNGSWSSEPESVDINHHESHRINHPDHRTGPDHHAEDTNIGAIAPYPHPPESQS